MAGFRELKFEPDAEIGQISTDFEKCRLQMSLTVSYHQDKFRFQRIHYIDSFLHTLLRHPVWCREGGADFAILFPERINKSFF